ncbi:MAG: galactokinase family protein, partial [Anaerolineales bacterium]
MDISAQFKHNFNCPPTHISRAPGRVNLIGEHVDYNDGPVLPVAIDRTVKIAAAGSTDNKVHLHALDLEERVSFNLASLEAKIDLTGNPLPAWARYPAGVAWSLKVAGLDVRGLRAVYTSDVPIGAGLSSSAAVEVGFAALWQALGGWDIDRLELARLCQRAENDYVGMPCGLMDQFVSACGVEGHALYFDTRSLEWLAAPLPPGTSIVIADSGVRRSLINSAYSERRASCERAVDLLKE